MITILGTSHVSTQSSKEAKLAIGDADIVCLELDQGRFQGLMSNHKATFSEMRQALGTKAALLASGLRWFQEKIAKNLGVLPGVEMRAAIKEAAKQQKPLALIDQEISITLRKLGKNFGWPEIRQMMRDGFKKQKISIHPDDDLVSQLLEQMKHAYPRIYKVMVSERDVHMAKALVALHEQHPEKRILAVVGKAHVPGMLSQITYLNKEIAVQLWTLTKKNESTSSS